MPTKGKAMPSSSTGQIVAVGVASLFVIALGALLSLYFGRRARNSADWLSAPGQLPLIVVVITQFATAVGGGVLIAHVGIAYAYGWSVFAYEACVVLGFFSLALIARWLREQRFTTVRAEHPEFQGRTALMASPYEGYFIYGTQDPRSRLLTDLGFKLPGGLDQVIGDKFGGTVSAERISLLDQQALVWFPSKGGTAKLQNDPLYRNLNVRKQGRDIFIEENYDDQLYGATSFVSVLSLPIVLDQLVPKLAAAVDGNPATTA